MSYLPILGVGGAALVVGVVVGRLTSTGSKTGNSNFDVLNPIFWDELQETIMIVGALALWAAFEFLCYTNSDYAEANHTNTTRLVITNIVNALFTFKFTKSQVRRNGDSNGK